MVKVDLTQKGDPQHARLLQQYNVKGVPTVVFLDAQGTGNHRPAVGGLSPAGSLFAQNGAGKKIKNSNRRSHVTQNQILSQ